MRTQPHDSDAERAVLGSMLLDQAALDGAADELDTSDFFRPSHGVIFDAIVSAGASDVVVVANALGESLADCGGRAALLDLQSAVSTASRWKHYAAIVADTAKRRRIIELSAGLTTAAYNGDDIEPHLQSVTASDRQGVGAMTLGAVIGGLDLTARSEYQSHDIMPDTHIRRGDLVVVGARPSVGKTAYALQLSRDFASDGEGVLFYGYEMSSESLARRHIHAMTGISRNRQDDGLTENQAAAVHKAVQGKALDALRLDDSCPSLRKLVRGIYDFARDGGRCVVVDYLQIAVTQTTEEVTKASRALKMAANDPRLVKRNGNRVVADLRPTVIVLSQLNRGVVREDGTLRPPTLGDLRQSGAIEQDADIAVLLHAYSDGDEAVRERFFTKGMWIPEYDALKGSGAVVKTLAHIDIAKSRDGMTRMSPAWWSGDDQTWQLIDRKV